MKVIWSDLAKEQLEDIFNFASRNSELYAERLVNRLVSRADMLGDFLK